jgi:hypothetical protein
MNAKALNGFQFGTSAQLKFQQRMTWGYNEKYGDILGYTGDILAI